MSSRSTLSVKEAVARGIARRYRNEAMFRALGLGALLIGLGFLAFFFYTLVGNGYTALEQTRIRLDVELDAAVIDPEATRDPETLRGADYQRLARDALGALVPRGDEPRRSARAVRALERRRRHRAARARRERARCDRRDAHAVAARRRRHRRARQGPRASRRSRGGPPHRRPAARLVDGARAAGPRRLAVQSILLHARRLERSRARRHLGRDGRLVLHVARDARAVVSARRRDGDLSRGVRAAQPLDGSHRGQHQQSRGRAVDRLRLARARAVHQRVRLAALGAARRRPRAEPHDAARDHHRVARRADGRAAVDSRGGARASAHRRCRWCCITCCRSRCPAC